MDHTNYTIPHLLWSRRFRGRVDNLWGTSSSNWASRNIWDCSDVDSLCSIYRVLLTHRFDPLSNNIQVPKRDKSRKFHSKRINSFTEKDTIFMCWYSRVICYFNYSFAYRWILSFLSTQVVIGGTCCGVPSKWKFQLYYLPRKSLP